MDAVTCGVTASPDSAVMCGGGGYRGMGGGVHGYGVVGMGSWVGVHGLVASIHGLVGSLRLNRAHYGSIGLNMAQ